MGRAAFLLIRYAHLAVCCLSWLYCLFAYIPFTWTQVLTAGLLPFLATFARIHAWLFCGAQVAALATLWRDLRDRRIAALVYAALTMIAVSALVVHPVLPRLQNDTRSLIWSNIALLFPLGLAVVDHIAARTTVVFGTTSTREDGAVFGAAGTCLAVVFVVYSATFHLRAMSSIGLTYRDEFRGLAQSLFLHASFVGLAFAAWCLVRALATLLRGPVAWLEYVLVSVLAASLLALLTRNIAFTSIAFRGTVATTVSALWAFVFVFSISGNALRAAARTNTAVVSGLRLLLSAVSCPEAMLAVRIGWLVGVAGLAVRLQVVASRMDWNGLMQRLCACFGWLMVFAAALQLWKPRGISGTRTTGLIFLGSLATLSYGIWRGLGHPSDTAPIRDKLAAAEPSFGLLYDVGTPEEKHESLSELFEFMQRNTSFGVNRPIAPLDVRFSNELGTLPTKLPHVFIIVVDSLRRDYLSTYNPAVTFTPSLDKFARSNDVFLNAFTHYGATGLSEPSIWVGGMMPHKQYIEPFGPMNALEKLVMADHYTRMVTVDSILAQLLDLGPSLLRLDEHVVTRDLDLCATLDEIQTKISARHGQEHRFFAYTQPQNIHVSRITAEGASVPPGASYPGFYAPYASRLQRIDACFGRFIQYLEAEGLYDDSIVVFTADHGDMLGEEGRWGHAYMLNPEIVRIPLIIHRPERTRKLSVDTKSVVFSTDITPSIYRLLGYMPAALGAEFGQSRYGTRTQDREWHMLVSSYGPVYGILEDEGTHLYVADAVTYGDAYFDVAAGSNTPRQPPSEQVRSRNMTRIRTGVSELHDVFHVSDPGATPQNATASVSTPP